MGHKCVGCSKDLQSTHGNIWRGNVSRGDRPLELGVDCVGVAAATSTVGVAAARRFAKSLSGFSQQSLSPSPDRLQSVQTMSFVLPT